MNTTSCLNVESTRSVIVAHTGLSVLQAKKFHKRNEDMDRLFLEFSSKLLLILSVIAMGGISYCNIKRKNE